MGIKNPGQFSALPDVQLVIKAADETVNNSNVLQDDDELTIPIGATQVWLVKVGVLCTSSVGADIKLSLTIPVGAQCYRHSHYIDSAGNQAFTVATEGVASIAAFGNGALKYRFVIEALVISAAAGNFTLQWAQNTAEVSDTKVLADSYIVAQRLR